jgi:hypothetical protein
MPRGSIGSVPKVLQTLADLAGFAVACAVRIARCRQHLSGKKNPHGDMAQCVSQESPELSIRKEKTIWNPPTDT